MKSTIVKSILVLSAGLALNACTVKGTSKAFPGPGLPKGPGPEAPKEQPASTPVLKAGDYKPVSGNLAACPQNIGVARRDGVVANLYVTLMPPCDGSTIFFTCENGTVCRGNGAVLTIKSESSYEYNDVDKGWISTFAP